MNLSVTDRYREICLLEGEEARCILSKRYHVIRLCDGKREIFDEDNLITVETPQTFDPGRRFQMGTRSLLQKAAFTDALLHKVRPKLEKGEPDYKAVRIKIARLQKLAKILRMLTDVYRIGNLALLPSGCFEASLTDDM
jgi:hypothetical protein